MYIYPQGITGDSGAAMYPRRIWGIDDVAGQQ